MLVFIQVAAQGIEKRQPLDAVLQQLEDKYMVTFSYADTNIEGISIPNPPSDISLKEVLQFLEQQTNLDFQQLDDRFITISDLNRSRLTVCGIIIDEETGEKLSGATIQTSNQNTISNEDGFFEVNPIEENETITIQFLGYHSLKLFAHSFVKSGCDSIFLRPEIITLPGISITNYIIEGIDKKVDGTFQIDTEVMGILPGLIEPDVLQTVQALPGIQSVNELVSDINIRGGTHDQNLILWDGIKMYQSGHFFGLISAFNPYTTQKVSLIKNGTRAGYSDGVSGTIHMETEKDLANRLSGGAGINMINADFLARIPLSPKMSVQISARRSIADFIKTTTYQKYYERAFRDTELINSLSDTDSIITSDENFYFYDFSMNYRYNLSHRDHLSLNLLFIKNNIDYQEDAKYDTLIDNRRSGLKQKSVAAGISYDRQWTEKIQSSAFVYLSSYILNAVNNDILNDQRLIQENEVLDTGIKLETAFQFSDHFNLTAGYQFFEIGIGNLEDINNPIFRRYIKRVIRNHVLFTEVNHESLSGNSNIRAGLRTSYFSKFKRLILEPRLTLNQKIFNNLSVEILGEIKSQVTSQVIDYQNDFLGIEKRRWILSDNDSIPIIRSRQVSVGVNYQLKNLLISLESYYKNVRGITSSSQGFQNQFQFIRSIGNYDALGLDLLINPKFKNLSTWLSYSLARNTFEFKDFNPSQFPNNLDLRHSITLGTSYEFNRLQISSGVNWHSGIPYTEPIEEDPVQDNRINYQNPNSARTDGYLRVDLSVKYQVPLRFKDSRMIIGASLWNILNSKNIIDLYYLTDSGGQIESIKRYSLGLTPNFLVRIDL
jgi:hypothetical protein